MKIQFIKDLIYALRKELELNVKLSNTSGLLFSGGLDSSILAFLKQEAMAITVTFESMGEDIQYADFLASKLGLNHYHKIVNLNEAINSIPEVIKILKSFDPAIPNDLVIYFSLITAKEMGIDQVITGDGADELFAGYEFMRRVEDLESYIKKLTSSLVFNSNILGNYLSIKINQPYLSREFMNLALNIPIEFKIREEKGKVWGKWILRKAFKGLLPSESIWQEKRPMEQGSGMSGLRKIISDIVSDEEFERGKRESQVKFLNKEHFYYYRIYQKVVGSIPHPQKDEKECPGCGGRMKGESSHCQICGWVKAII